MKIEVDISNALALNGYINSAMGSVEFFQNRNYFWDIAAGKNS